MCSLLDINTSSQVIGVNFIEYMPAPFDLMHKGVLARFLFFRNSGVLRRGHFFLLDSNKFCFEVTMYFRVAIYRCYPYFIVTFLPMIPSKDLILCLPHGQIISMSKRVKLLFPAIRFSIFDFFPNIESYLAKYDYEEEFNYNEPGFNLNMKKYFLTIDGYEMIIIYLLEVNMNLNGPNIRRRVGLDTRKKVEIQENFSESKEMHAESKNKIALMQSNKKIKLNTEKKFNMDNINRFSKALNLSFRICIGIEIIMTLLILIIIFKIINSITLNSVIFDVGLLRFLSNSNLLNARSLELINDNYTLAFGKAFYQGLMISNSFLLENILENHREIQYPVTNKKRYYFEEKTIIMKDVVEDKIVEKEITLYDAIQNVIQFSQIIANSTNFFSSDIHEKKMYFYMNLPTIYIKILNDTIMEIMSDCIDSVILVFDLLEYLMILCLVPPLFIFICSIVYLILIEKSNRDF